MNKTKIRKSVLDQEEMLPEYDFRSAKGVRGKYYHAMRQGYTILVHRKDGTTLVKEMKPKGTILLEPDVQKHFPDSKSVNAALRTLIAPAPLKRTMRTRETPGVYRVRRVAKSKHSSR